MHIPVDSSYFLPVAVPVVAVAIALLAFLVMKRNRTCKISHDEMYSQFIPPIIGQNIPKEQTYIVPRHWKPPSSSVYAPLSIPIPVHQQRTNTLFTLPNIRPNGSKGIALIHALPPSTESKNAGISPEFV